MSRPRPLSERQQVLLLQARPETSSSAPSAAAKPAPLPLPLPLPLPAHLVAGAAAPPGWSRARRRAWLGRGPGAENFLMRYTDGVGDGEAGVREGSSWGRAETRLLVSAVREVGSRRRWGRISLRVPGRCGRECRQWWAVVVRAGFVGKGGQGRGGHVLWAAGGEGAVVLQRNVRGFQTVFVGDQARKEWLQRRRVQFRAVEDVVADLKARLGIGEGGGVKNKRGKSEQLRAKCVGEMVHFARVAARWAKGPGDLAAEMRNFARDKDVPRQVRKMRTWLWEDDHHGAVHAAVEALSKDASGDDDDGGGDGEQIVGNESENEMESERMDAVTAVLTKDDVLALPSEDEQEGGDRAAVDFATHGDEREDWEEASMLREEATDALLALAASPPVLGSDAGSPSQSPDGKRSKSAAGDDDDLSTRASPVGKQHSPGCGSSDDALTSPDTSPDEKRPSFARSRFDSGMPMSKRVSAPSRASIEFLLGECVAPEADKAPLLSPKNPVSWPSVTRIHGGRAEPGGRAGADEIILQQRRHASLAADVETHPGESRTETALLGSSDRHETAASHAGAEKEVRVLNFTPEKPATACATEVCDTAAALGPACQTNLAADFLHSAESSPREVIKRASVAPKSARLVSAAKPPLVTTRAGNSLRQRFKSCLLHGSKRSSGGYPSSPQKRAKVVPPKPSYPELQEHVLVLRSSLVQWASSVSFAGAEVGHVTQRRRVLQSFDDAWRRLDASEGTVARKLPTARVGGGGVMKAAFHMAMLDGISLGAESAREENATAEFAGFVERHRDMMDEVDCRQRQELATMEMVSSFLF